MRKTGKNMKALVTVALVIALIGVIFAVGDSIKRNNDPLYNMKVYVENQKVLPEIQQKLDRYSLKYVTDELGNFEYAPATEVVKNHPDVNVLDSINARVDYENPITNNMGLANFKESPRYKADAFMSYNMIELTGQYINYTGMMYSAEDEFEVAIKEEKEALIEICGKNCDTNFEVWMRAFEQYIINEKEYSERCPHMYKLMSEHLEVYTNNTP